MGLTGLVVRTTVLLLVGWCLARLLRNAPAGARHLVWLTVMIGVLLLPALAQMTPLRVAVLPSTGVAAPLPLPVATASRSAPVLPTAPSPFTIPDIAALVIATWLAISAALLGWLVLGTLSVRRIQRGARALDSPVWSRALQHAADRLDLAVVPRLLVSDRTEIPFACNVLSPTIVLPSTATEWSADRRHAVLLHELAHVRRRDLLGHAIARVACAVYWFHPLMWVAARRLRSESEQACDDLVLTNGMRASDYAQHLLDMVTNVGAHQGAPADALPLVRRSEFEGRLLAILDRAQRRNALGRVHVGALVGVLGLSTMSIAAVVPVPRVIAVLPGLRHDSLSVTRDTRPMDTASKPVASNNRRRTPKPGPVQSAGSVVLDPPLVIRVSGADSTYLLTAERVHSACSVRCQAQFAEQRYQDSVRRARLPNGGRGGGAFGIGRGNSGFGVNPSLPMGRAAGAPPDSLHVSRPNE